MPDSETEQEVASLTQLSYKSTGYSDQSWEVIGEMPQNVSFEPMEIEILPTTGMRTDPMFADYGGGMNEGPGVTADNRWQLPDLSRKGGKRHITASLEEDDDENTISEEEMNRLIAEAEKRGKLEAMEEAIALQNEKLSKIESSMNNILQDLHKQLVENISRVEKEALNFSLAISEKLLLHTVEVVPDYIAKVIKEAIRLCGSATVGKIRVSPQDLEFIEIVGISKQLKQGDSEWQFEADSSIRAGCVIETSAGEVDYQLDAAFERIKDNVLKVKR